MYLGLPGDGKSVSGVRCLVDELRKGFRSVVSNLPLEMGELEAYLRANAKDDCKCWSRVVELVQKQVRKFWLIRPDGWRLIDIGDEQYSQNQFPDLGTCYRWVKGDGSEKRPDLATLTLPEVLGLVEKGLVETGETPPAVYILDESQNFWPSRSYQTTPKGFMFYLSQHRHLGDDCYFITQKETQVEKVVRNLVSAYWVFRNLGKRRRFGFRLPAGWFSYARFAEPPGGQGAVYEATGMFRLDIEGLAKCYRTASGVGIGGTHFTADTGERKGGAHWGFGVGIVVAVVVAACAIPMVSTGLISKWLLGRSEKLGTNAAPVVAPRPAAVVTAAPPVRVVAPEVKVAPVVAKRTDKPSEVKPVRSTNSIAGAMHGVDGWTIVLADGRLIGEEDCQRILFSSDGRHLRRIQYLGEWHDWSAPKGGK